MKGIIDIKELSNNNGGVFVSELDYDKSFSREGNKKGYFVMIISPIENEIRYVKQDDGTYLVYGESWIISGNKKQIESKVAGFIEDLKEDNVQYINEDSCHEYEFECKSDVGYYSTFVCGENIIDAKRRFRNLSKNKILNVREVEFQKYISR